MLLVVFCLFQLSELIEKMPELICMLSPGWSAGCKFYEHPVRRQRSIANASLAAQETVSIKDVSLLSNWKWEMKLSSKNRQKLRGGVSLVSHSPTLRRFNTGWCRLQSKQHFGLIVCVVFWWGFFPLNECHLSNQITSKNLTVPFKPQAKSTVGNKAQGIWGSWENLLSSLKCLS